jgi:signal transduction histidine kinase
LAVLLGALQTGLLLVPGPAGESGPVARGLGPGLIGFAIGTLLTVLVTMALVRRHMARVRAADARARRAKRLAELGAMTRGLAHEIKNPLSTIGLNVQLLTESIEDLRLDEDDRGPLLRRLGSLGREAERLRGILTDFLEYAGELHLEPRPADLNATVDELIDFFLPQADSQGVRVRSDLSRGELLAWIDPPHIKQAVLNLMLNALQAMARQPEGVPRELILRTGHETGEAREPVAVLHVIDTGPGIPADAIERIFDPYFTTKAGGSGLGLPTARRIIEGHGGRLEVHSEPGRGTDFSVSLPCERTEIQRERPATG